MAGGRSRSGREMSGGFSLLEMVVTLVLVSLLVTVLMQMLGQALAVRTRLLHYQQVMQMSYLKEGWFRDVVAASQLDESDALPAFSGKSHEFSHMSAVPLLSSGLTRVRWELRFDQRRQAALYYAEGASDPVPILDGPLDNARFSFRGDSGEWLVEWESGPVVVAPGEQRVGLPQVVRFEAETPNGRVLWLVPLMVNGAMPRLSDLGVEDAAE